MQNIENRSCSVQHRIKPKPARISIIEYQISNIDRARLKVAIFVIFMTSFTVLSVGLIDVGLTFLTSIPGIEDPRPKVGLPVEFA